MQGIATLSAYAGQTIYFNGTGSLSVNNYAAYMAGTGSLSAISSLSGKSTMNLTSYFSAAVGVATTANSVCPAFNAFGSEIKNYAQATVTLPAFVSDAYMDTYTPETQTGAFSIMPAFTSIGLLSVTYILTGDVSCPAFSAIGSEGAYSQASSNLPSFFSLGFEGYKDRIVEIDRVSVTNPMSTVGSLLIVCMSNGSILSVNEATRQAVYVFTDSLTADSVLSTLGTFNVSAISSLLADSLNSAGISGFPALDDSNTVWCVNLETGAASQYEQYGFSSFFKRDEKYYGVADDGIYELSGSDDAGNVINGLIEFGKSNFNIPQEKRINNVYLGISNSTGTIYLKVDADGVEYTYEMRSSSAELKNHRVDVGRGLSGNYWNFTLVDSGSDFDLATIQFEPVILSRKIK